VSKNCYPGITDETHGILNHWRARFWFHPPFLFF